MRRRAALTAVFLALLAVLPLSAQQRQPSSSLQGVSGSQRVNVPINVNSATRSYQNKGTVAQTPNATRSPFRLSHLVPGVTLQGLPTFGSSNTPQTTKAAQKKQ